MSLAQQLAYLDFNKEKEVSDPYTVRIDSFLTIFSERYQLPKDSIADYTHKTQSLIKTHNILISSEKIMESINNVPETISKGSKYKDLLILFAMTTAASEGK